MLWVICSSNAGSWARVDVGLCERVADVDVGGQPRRAPLASQIQQLVDGRQILLGDAQARLRAAKLHVVLRHIRENRHQHRALILDRDLHARLGGLHGAAYASEQIDFPGGGAAQLKLVVRIRNGKPGAARHVDGADRS